MSPNSFVRCISGISCILLAASPAAAQQLYSSSETDQARSVQIEIDGGQLEIPHRYFLTAPPGEPRIEVSIESLADGLAASMEETMKSVEVDLSVRELDFSAAAQRIIDGLDMEMIEDEQLRLIMEFRETPGLEALVADELVSFAVQAQLCRLRGGTPLSQTYLIQSRMDLHYNLDTRGAQMDIASLKYRFCVLTNPIGVSVMIVDRRWVVNVENGALEPQFGVTSPNGTPYPFALFAQGEGISLVSYYVDGVLQPSTVWNYQQGPNSCIQIFFPQQPSMDGPILVSTPGSLAFCAGGFCKKNPPGLDATN